MQPSEPSPVAEARSPTTGPAPSPPKRRADRSWWIVVTVIFVAALIIGVYLADERLTRKGSSGGSSETVLIPQGTIDSFPAGQFNAVTLTVTTAVVVNGSITTTLGIAVYAMTTIQFQSFVRNVNLNAGYNWTSGTLAYFSIDHVHIALGPGAWDVVFDDPSELNSTMVEFLTPFTETIG